MQHTVTGQTAFGVLGPMADRPEGRFDRIAGSNALPLLGGEVMEGHQLLPVFVQAQCRFRVFRFVGFDEQIKSLLRLCPRLRLPDGVQRLLRFWLN